MHASLYRVHAQTANNRLKKQTAVGVWTPGWQPSTLKQNLEVSVHSRVQKVSGLWGSVAETLQEIVTLHYTSA